MAEIKFTEDEMKKLKDMQDNFNSMVLQFGQLKVEQLNLARTTQRLEDVKDKLESDYQSLLVSEKTLSAELNTKYGDGVLDPSTGIFTPNTKKTQ